MTTWGLTANLLAAAAPILLALRTENTMLRVLRPLAWTGTLAYALYMVHPLVVSPVSLDIRPHHRNALSRPSPSLYESRGAAVDFLLIPPHWGIAVTFAYMLTALIERPPMTFRNRP